MEMSAAVRNVPAAFTGGDFTGASRGETCLDAAVGPEGQILALPPLCEALQARDVELRGWCRNYRWIPAAGQCRRAPPHVSGQGRERA